MGDISSTNIMVGSCTGTICCRIMAALKIVFREGPDSCDVGAVGIRIILRMVLASRNTSVGSHKQENYESGISNDINSWKNYVEDDRN